MPNQPIDWERTARAFTHELRIQFLETFADSAEPQSAKSLSEQFNKPLANCAYHVKQLHEKGLIKLVGTEPRRGALEKLYVLAGGE